MKTRVPSSSALVTVPPTTGQAKALATAQKPETAPALIFGDLWSYDPAPETAEPYLKARYDLFIDDSTDVEACSRSRVVLRAGHDISV